MGSSEGRGGVWQGFLIHTHHGSKQLSSPVQLKVLQVPGSKTTLPIPQHTHTLPQKLLPWLQVLLSALGGSKLRGDFLGGGVREFYSTPVPRVMSQTLELPHSNPEDLKMQHLAKGTPSSGGNPADRPWRNTALFWKVPWLLFTLSPGLPP